MSQELLHNPIKAFTTPVTRPIRSHPMSHTPNRFQNTLHHFPCVRVTAFLKFSFVNELESKAEIIAKVERFHLYIAKKPHSRTEKTIHIYQTIINPPEKSHHPASHHIIEKPPKINIRAGMSIT